VIHSGCRRLLENAAELSIRVRDASHFHLLFLILRNRTESSLSDCPDQSWNRFGLIIGAGRQDQPSRITLFRKVERHPQRITSCNRLCRSRICNAYEAALTEKGLTDSSRLIKSCTHFACHISGRISQHKPTPRDKSARAISSTS
jgi:hypothetical protein